MEKTEMKKTEMKSLRDNKTARLELRLSDADKRKIMCAARKENRSCASYLRCLHYKNIDEN